MASFSAPSTSPIPTPSTVRKEGKQVSTSGVSKPYTAHTDRPPPPEDLLSSATASKKSTQQKPPSPTTGAAAGAEANGPVLVSSQPSKNKQPNMLLRSKPPSVGTSSPRPPDAEVFAFDSILSNLGAEADTALDAIAEICGRGWRMSLAGEYGVHLPPGGSGERTKRSEGREQSNLTATTQRRVEQSQTGGTSAGKNNAQKRRSGMQGPGVQLEGKSSPAATTVVTASPSPPRVRQDDRNRDGRRRSSGWVFFAPSSTASMHDSQQRDDEVYDNDAHKGLHDPRTGYEEDRSGNGREAERHLRRILQAQSSSSSSCTGSEHGHGH